MGKKLNHEQKGQLADLVMELMRVAVNGIRPFDQVCRGVQNIIEGKLTQREMYQLPTWWTGWDTQIEKVSAFLEKYGDGKLGFRPSDIPLMPDKYTLNSPNEAILLTVMLPDKGRVKGFQRTFDAWWNFIVPPSGLDKRRWEELKSDSKRLRLVPGIDYRPGIRWVTFDPSTYQGKSPEQALVQSKIDGTILAHVEVFMAAALIPEWVASWNGYNSPCPYLSGCQFYWETDWSDVPYLEQWNDARQLWLGNGIANRADSGWASPTVREC